MHSEDSNIRNHLLQLILGMIIGVKPFMVQDLQQDILSLQNWVQEIMSDDGDLEVLQMARTLNETLQTLKILT